MKCNCCGRRKKLFESFEKINSELHVCVECSTLLYKLRDEKGKEDTNKYNSILHEINVQKEKKATKQFEKWFEEFK